MKEGKFNGHRVFLVENEEDIQTFKDNLELKLSVGLDTETTGLDYDKDHVVGFCISTGKTYSKEDYAGYYFPVRHKIGNNLDLSKVVELVQEVIDTHTTVLWNRNFDNSMMEKEGINIPFIGRMSDAQMMMHLVLGDNMPKLKKSAKDYLKWDMIEFGENIEEGDFNFGNTDPNISFVYAAGDPLATVFVAKKIWNEYPYIRTIYPLDNKATEAVRLLSKSPLFLDKSIVAKELSIQLSRQQQIQQKVFAIAGYRFKINSNKDKADALSRFVTLTTKTAKGQLKVDSETLSRIDHPLAHLLVEHGEVQKFISSYLEKMSNFPQPFRCSYSACNVATGRLSSGGNKKNLFFANFNIQNVPKTEEKVYVHLCEKHGQRISFEEEGAIGITKSKAGIRRAFTPPSQEWLNKNGYDGSIPWKWGSWDFISQEMVLMANFSREPNLCIPLNEGKDIHNYIAKVMFGSEDPNNRTKIKTLNFAVNYGAGEFTISQRLKITIDEAKALLSHYAKTLNKLEAWKESKRKEARSKGFVTTYFGRPRVLYKYYSMAGGGYKAFADRSAVNSPVQGPVTADTMILTNIGYCTIEFLLENDLKGIKVWTGMSWAPFKITNQGIGTVHRYNLSDGSYIDADVRHIFKVTDGKEYKWLDRQAIIGDTLCQSRPQALEINRIYDSEKMYWIGRLMGDGVIYDNSLAICCSREELSNLYKRACEYFTPLGYHVQPFYQTKGSKGETWQFRVSCKSWIDSLEELEYVKGRARTKRIYKGIYRTSLRDRRSFIQGFYDADGSKNTWPSWHLCQKQLLQDLQLLLRTVGIRSIINNCKDGSFKLNVAVKDWRREIEGIKEQTLHKGGMLVPNSIKKYFIDNVKTYESCDKALISKMRTGKNVTVCSAEKLYKKYGLKFKEIYEYSSIVSVELLGDKEVFCLSLEDESHSYDTNGVISHNCLPLYSYIETKDSVIAFSEALGKRFMTYDGRELVPTHRGDNEIIFVRFKSGDFVICDFNHQFVSGSLERPMVEKFRDGMPNPILLSKMHKKRLPNPLRVFKKSHKHASYLRVLLKTKQEIKNNIPEVNAAFWNLAITRYKFSIATIEQSRIRSLASIYGFNVKCNKKGDKFRVSFLRRNKTRLDYFKAVEDEGVRREVGSCTVMNGFQLYSTQGIVNKNTGGDLIRISLVKLFEELKNDEEFAKNVIPSSSVHDEINLYIHPNYLYKANKKMRQIMEYNPSNFVVPLQTSFSVGDDWGTLGEVHHVTEDNKLEYSYKPIEK